MFNLKKCPYCESELLVESEAKVKIWIETEEAEKSEPKSKEPKTNTDKKLNNIKERKKKTMITDDIRRAIVSRLKLGQGCTEISKGTGISMSAISKIKKDVNTKVEVEVEIPI